MGVFLKNYSIEKFVVELDAYMQANLPGVLAVMNADYTDLVLGSPSQYIFQTLQDRDIASDIFLFYGETDSSPRANGPDIVEAYTFQVAIIMANRNDAPGIMGKRLMRYRECLKDLFKSGWNKMNPRVRLEVSGISPFPFVIIGDQPTHVGIGVNLDFEIT